jgi:hypothetical protein
MAATASWYQSFFDNLIYRSNQFQMQALAGERDFVNYWEKLDISGALQSGWTDGHNLWKDENVLETLKQVDLKTMKYIEQNWADRKWERRNWDVVLKSDDSSVFEPDPVYGNWQLAAKDTTTTEMRGPNGSIIPGAAATIYGNSPSDWTAQGDKGKANFFEHEAYMTADQRYIVEQKHDYKRFADWESENRFSKYDSGRLTYDNNRWTEWERMHCATTIWFDNSACMQNDFMGKINDGLINMRPKDVNDNNTFRGTSSDWFTNNEQDNSRLVYNADQVVIAQRYGNDFKLDVAGVRWHGDEFKDLMQAKVDLLEDCDLECQAKGTQLTVIAGIMAAAYGLIALNAVFMFVGAWFSWARICSVYFTLFACVFQFGVMVATGAMLFTKYNNLCARSLFRSFEPFLWFLADDIFTTFSIWVTTWVGMFIWLCCGLCSAWRPCAEKV